jgi:leucyl aminopeptidase
MHFNIKKLLLIIILCTTSPIIDAKSTETNSIAVNPIYKIRYPNQVKQLLRQINPQEMWENLSGFTSFNDRAAVHESGKQAAYWIKEHLENIIKHTKRNDVAISLIQTEGTWPGTDINFKQPSIIVKIGNSTLPGIVIGAHIDTMAACGETVSCDKVPDTGKGPRPGADDDGSGVVTVMELARTLFVSQMHFKKPIYLIFYAGEEAGFAGSKIIVNDFKNKNIPIDAVMQFDMTGYACKNDLTMWLHLDKYTNKNLTVYSQELINFYVKRPVKITTKGIGGSDDMVWGMAGFNTVRPQESIDEFDKECGSFFMHSAEDTMDKISLTHMIDYLKLAVAFTVELAEPIKS